MTAEARDKRIIFFIKRHGPFLVILLLWVGAHLFFLPRKSLWHDEYYSILAANGRTQEIRDLVKSSPLLIINAGKLTGYLQAKPEITAVDFLTSLGTSDIHPPAFFILLRLWMQLGWSGVIGLSVLPLIISIIALLLLYRLSAALIASPYHNLTPLLWMISVHFWPLAVEVRQYSLCLLEAVLLTMISIRAYREPERLSRGPFTLLMAAVFAVSLLTFYLFVFLIAALNLWLISHPEVRKRQRIIGLIKANALGLILVLPWIYFAMHQFGAQSERLVEAMTLWEVCRSLVGITLHFIITPQSLLSLPALLVLIALVAGMWREPFPGFRRLFIAVALFCLLLPAFLFYVKVLAIYQLFRVKYFLAAMPVVLLAAVKGIEAWPGRWLRAVAALVLVTMVTINLVTFIQYDEKSRQGSSPGAESSVAVLMRFLEKSMPEDYAIVLDTTSEVSILEIAGQVKPQRILYIGDCSTIPRELAKHISEAGPSLIYYMHLKDSGPRGKSDCTPEISSALAASYHAPNPPGEIRNWRGIYFVRR